MSTEVSFFARLEQMKNKTSKAKTTSRTTKVNLPKLQAELSNKQERLTKLENTFQGRLDDNSKTEQDIKEAWIEKSIIEKGIEAMNNEPEAKEFLEESGMPKFLDSRDGVCARIIEKGLNTIKRRTNANATTEASIKTLEKQIAELQADIAKFNQTDKPATPSVTDAKQTK